MSAKKKNNPIARLEKKIAQMKAAERKKVVNEDIVRLEKNGDISYETVRTVGVRRDGKIVDCDGRVIGREAGRTASDADDATSPIPANSHLLPNTLPETPAPHEIGNLI